MSQTTPTPLLSSDGVPNVSVVPALMLNAGNAIVASTSTDPVLAQVRTALATSIQVTALVDDGGVGSKVTQSVQALADTIPTATAIAAATAKAQSDTSMATAISTALAVPGSTLAKITTASDPSVPTTLQVAIADAVTKLPTTIDTTPIDSVPATTTTSTTSTTSTTATSSSTTAPTSTTTTTTTTTTVPPSVSNYLKLGNTLGFNDGLASTAYTMADFQNQAKGIVVSWPMASNAAVQFTLTDGGTFNVGSGQTVRAAIEITDTAGNASVKAYIDSVNITKNGSAVTITVPNSAFARVYAMSADGSAVLSGFADVVVGVTNTFTIGSTSNIVLGNVVKNALSRLGSVSSLTNKIYKVTLVLANSPLRQADGTVFATSNVTVPGSLASGSAAVSVTGPSLSGYIKLVDAANPTATTTTVPTSSTTTLAPTTTTTVATTTTTTVSTADNALYLASDTISYFNGSSDTPYTVSQFQSGAGLTVNWPVANTAALKFSLVKGANFVLPTQPVKAALEITDANNSTGARVVAYIDGVNVSQSGANVNLSVPSNANGRVYFKSSTGDEARCSWSSCGIGSASTILNSSSSTSLVLGQIINNAVKYISGGNPVSGKYAVKLVVAGLPLRLTSTATLSAVSIAFPNGSLAPIVTSGLGLQGFITVVNASRPVPTTTTTTTTTSAAPTTTTTTSTTTTTVSLPATSLYLANDSITYSNGSSDSVYSVTQFGTGSGITVNWPVANSAALKFSLTAGASFVAPTQPVRAALEITDANNSNGAKVIAYINGVNVSQNTNSITLSVPSNAVGRVYFKSATGSEVRCAWSSCGAGTTSKTFSTASGNVNTLVLGQLINNAVSYLSGGNPMSGKYAVTLVVSGLPISLSSGSLTTYSISFPNGSLYPTMTTGSGLTGFITVVNANSPVATSTTAATTTTTASVTTTTSAYNYLTLANDTLGFDNGTGSTSYTLAQFQSSPGIDVKWPMASTAALGFTLTDAGAFNVGSGQTFSAAMEIADITVGGKALLKAYIDSVKITKNGTAVTVMVPSTAFARIYARGADGSEVLSGFADAVAGVTNTFTTGSAGSIVLGNVVNNAMNRLGNVTGLAGKTFKVTLVLPNSPLRLASGTPFTSATVTVPVSLASGAVSVTGPSLTGYITLAP